MIKPARKKLLVILGAGSSVAQGMPTTNDVGGLLEKKSKEWTGERPDRLDYYNLLDRNREIYFREAPTPKPARASWNYERLLGDLQSLQNGLIPSPWGDPILQWLGKAEVFSRLALSSRGNLQQWAAIQAQQQHLYEALARYFRGSSIVFEFELNRRGPSPAFTRYLDLFRGLAAEFDLGIYNLNHDTVALNALPKKTFTGFDARSGAFDAAVVLKREEWSFLYHLHGSVHHQFKDRVIRWEKNLSLIGPDHDICTEAGSLERGDGRRLFATTLVAGGWKLDQLQANPFHTFYSTLVRHAYDADAVLIGGYGFGDEHVNSSLGNMLASGTKRPPLLILDRLIPDEYDRNSSDHHQWLDRLKRALRLQHAPEAFGRRAPDSRSFSEFVRAGKFEVSPRPDSLPLAAWYGGFESAHDRVEDICAWLAGDATALSS